MMPEMARKCPFGAWCTLSLYILSSPKFCSLESSHFKKIRRVKYNGSTFNVHNYQFLIKISEFLFGDVYVYVYATCMSLSSNPEPHTC